MPARSARALAAPCASAHSASFFFLASGSAATLASMPILIFSQTRGTANQIVGRASGSAVAIDRGSAMWVTWTPLIAWKYCADARSAMCADGRNDVIRSPKETSTTPWAEREIASMLRWVSWTPFGGPVVPEV